MMNGRSVLPQLSVSILQLLCVLICAIHINSRNVSVSHNVDHNLRHLDGMAAPNTLTTTVTNITPRIIVYAIQVADKHLDPERLNHYQYCKENGYEFHLFYLTPQEYAAKYGYTYKGNLDHIENLRGVAAWYSVLVAQELIEKYPSNATHPVYLFKMDLDCLFTRTDLRLEAFIDLNSNFSFYVSESDPNMLITQSHVWMLKTDAAGRAFVKEWLEYRFFGSCANAIVEQVSDINRCHRPNIPCILR